MGFDMNNPFHDERQSGSRAADAAPVPNRRLWFEVAGPHVAWFGLGFVDIVITWRACVHEEQFGGPSSHPWAIVLYVLSGILLFGLALLAGWMSLRSWSKQAETTDLLRSEGKERREFMSQAGFFTSLILGIGIVWLCLPVIIIEMCERIR